MDNIADGTQLYDEDIPAFQEKFGCKTTISVRLISDNLNKANGITTNDPKEIAQAKVFVDAIPRNDLDIYKNIRQAVEKAYVFNDNGPIYPSKYAKGLEGAVIDHDMLGEGKAFNIVKPSSLTPEEEERLREEQRKKDESAIDPIPGHMQTNQDKLGSKELTQEEKIKRYRDLLASYNTAMRNGLDARRAFEDSPEYAELGKFATEFKFSKAGKFRG